MSIRGVLGFAVLLTACGDPPAPVVPKPMTPVATARLAEFADASTWENLDAERPGHHLRDPRTGVVFVRVAAGTFDMGNDKVPIESPRHSVTLSNDYLLAETELTVAQWQRFVNEYAGDPLVEIPEGSDTLPMTLSFDDANKLATTMSYRLPTEAEWERACCGGLALEAEPWTTEAGMRSVAWFHRNADYKSHPVREKEPNAFGLYDMLGNLWEWCVDDFDPIAYGKRTQPVTDPVGSTHGQHRIIRGGSWFSVPPATPRTRSSAAVNERTKFFGARFAVNAPPLR